MEKNMIFLSPNVLLVDNDMVLAEDINKDMWYTNNNEQIDIGGWWDDVIDDEDDTVIHECLNDEVPRHWIFRRAKTWVILNFF